MDLAGMIGVSLIIAFATMVLGFGGLLFIWAKSWIDRSPMPSAGSVWFVQWLEHTVWRGNYATYEDYAVELIVSCIFLFCALAVISLCIYTPPVLYTAGTAILIAGGMYSARWMRDTKKSIDSFDKEK